MGSPFCQPLYLVIEGFLKDGMSDCYLLQVVQQYFKLKHFPISFICLSRLQSILKINDSKPVTWLSLNLTGNMHQTPHYEQIGEYPGRVCHIKAGIG